MSVHEMVSVVAPNTTKDVYIRIDTMSKKCLKSHGSESKESSQDTGESQGAYSKANTRGSDDGTVSSATSRPTVGRGGRSGRTTRELLEGGEVVGTRLDSVDREDHARLAVVDLATVAPDGCSLERSG
jgi:hypothetical protein